MAEVLINPDATVAYLPGVDALVRTGTSNGKATTPEAGKQPTTPTVKQVGSGDIALWGDDNLFPQNVVKECEKNTIIPSTLDWKARALYSGGIMYGTVDYKEDGSEKFTPAKDPAVDAFFRRSNIKRYLIESAQDFYWFYNLFPEIILSKDRSQIVAISAQEATYCRWGKQNDKTGLVEQCYINANWDNGGNADNATKVSVLDPYYDPVYNLQQGKDYKYIYPVSYPSPGKTYYQLAHWNSLRSSGWLDVAQSVPLFKKALFKNQLTIKYLIEIATWYWTWKYPSFESLKPEERQNLMRQELENFQTMMTGEEKSGNTIMVTTKTDQNGKMVEGWKITPIDNKIKDGIYIEDSQEASSHLLFALGVDPTLIGNSPGRNMGAGSGSDKRVAFNVYISLCKIHQDLILEPLELIRDYNDWNPEYVFRFRNSLITTLDTGKQMESKTTGAGASNAS